MSHGKLADGGRTKKAEKKEPREEPRETNGPLPAGFVPIASAGQSQLGLPLRIHCEKDGSEMALVTGGASILGHNGGPKESSPQITVVLDSFYMDMNEVTLRQYDAFRAALKEEKGRNYLQPALNAASGPDYPVLGVTLLQGTSTTLAGPARKSPRKPSGNGRPEANPVSTTHGAMGEQSGSMIAARMKSTPWRSFLTDVSPYGIYDMAGNAREWCVDHYSPSAFAEAQEAQSGELRNWKGPRKGMAESDHVVKGNGPNWNAWHRSGMDSSERIPTWAFVACCVCPTTKS